jgi:hypothetical protein
MGSLRGFVRILGIGTVAAILFSACGDTPPNSVTDVDASASPTSTAGAEGERATDARAEDIPATPTASVESQQQADFFVPFARLGRDPKWQEVFDLLTPSEQSCIREELDEETLEYIMDSLVYDLIDDIAPRPWAVSLISCLLPDTNRAVFLHKIVGDLDRFLHYGMGMTTSIEQVSCIRDRVDDLGMASVLTDFANGDSGVTLEIGLTVLVCAPEFLYIAIALQMGMELRDLSEEEKACIQKWIDGLDEEDMTILFSPQGNPAATADLSIGVMACVPELFLAGFAEVYGVELEELAEDEISCLKDWLNGLDQDELAILLSPEDNPQAALELRSEMTDCIPDLPTLETAETMLDPVQAPTMSLSRVTT